MTRRWLAALMALVSLLATLGGAQAQTVPSQYFPLTGHAVRGEFLDFFNARGGLQIFGYPITEEVIKNGRQMQYFQRLRLDLYPENPPPFRVRTGPLGELMGRGEPPIPASDIPPAGDPNRRYFPETGHTVIYSFLGYFDEHGGIDLFGYPITEYNPETGLQYFQCARMEWHPDLAPEQRVQLGNLGEAYAMQYLREDERKPPPDLLDPQVIVLKAVASVQSAITGRTGTQTLHVYVVNQHGLPVPSANIAAVVHFPFGDQVLALTTNAAGHAAGTFKLEHLVPGQRISIDVRVGFGALAASTRTSFLVWW